MSLNLVADWKRIVKKAISFKLAIIAGLLSSVVTIMAVFIGRDSSPLFFAVFVLLSVCASVACFATAAARVTAQPKMYAPEPKK